MKIILKLYNSKQPEKSRSSKEFKFPSKMAAEKFPSITKQHSLMAQRHTVSRNDINRENSPPCQRAGKIFVDDAVITIKADFQCLPPVRPPVHPPSRLSLALTLDPLRRGTVLQPVQPVTSWAARMAASESRKPFGKRQTLSGSIVTRSRARKFNVYKEIDFWLDFSRKKFPF